MSVSVQTLLRKHVLVIQKDGRLCEPTSDGKEILYKNNDDKKCKENKECKECAECKYIDGIISNIKIWEQENKNNEKKILIFIHGGLNEFENSYIRAKKLLFCESRNGEILDNRIPDTIYPIFINWESGTFSAYKDYVCNIRQGDTFSGWKKSAWLVASPFLVLGDLGKGIARLPYTSGYQIQNYVQTQPDRHELATEKINEWYTNPEKTGATNNDNTVPVTVSDVEYKQHLDIKRLLIAVPESPFKLLSAMIIDAGGKGAWETMVRRTQTMFNAPDEFAEIIQLYAFMSKTAIANVERKAKEAAEKRVIPRHTGSLSKFMDKFDDYLKNSANRNNYEITLIGHSMGTIVANEILHRYNEFPFKHIVYMGAACSINDFRVNVIPYLRNHSDGEFYNLCLHPFSEHRESHFCGLIPRGSLLEWLDNFLTSPNTTLDRRMGKWENILRTSSIIPNEVRERIYFKAFKQERPNKKSYKEKCEACEECHKPLLQKPPENPGSPQKHSEFTDQIFWEKDFWDPKHQ